MNEPIHVASVRTVKPGCEAAFEQALHDFVQRSLTLPGQTGVHIIRPRRAAIRREYGIIRGFADREALAAFRTRPNTWSGIEFALGLTEGSGQVRGNFPAWKLVHLARPTAPPAAMENGLGHLSSGLMWSPRCCSGAIGPVIQTWPFLIS